MYSMWKGFVVTNKKVLISLSIQKGHFRLNINSCSKKVSIFHLQIKSNLNVSFKFSLIILSVYSRLFTQTVNNNEAMPSVATSSNSLQFQLCIDAELRVWLACLFFFSFTTCGSTCNLLLSREVH